MKFNIDSAARISTLLAFIRAAAKGEFKVSKELIAEVMERCSEFARKHGIQIHVKGRVPQQLLTYISVGAAIGAAAGFVLGAGAGAVGGALAGAAIGAALSHVSITVDLGTFGDATFTIG